MAHFYQKKQSTNSLLLPASESKPTFQLQDNRPQSTIQKKLAEEIAGKQQGAIIQKKTNNTGLPNQLKSGIESLSGHSMNDVKVHYNSAQPAQLNAHAYAQGSNIHIAPGQEKHLPHEAWHVVQQKQGRVKPTMQMKGQVNVNDDAGLEKEADIMGAKALQMKANPHASKENSQAVTGSKSNVVQKKGVKRELLTANAKLEDLHNEAGLSIELLSKVSNALYDFYKPPMPGTPPMMDTASSKGRNKPNLKTFNEVVGRAQSLNHWADTANSSAVRIFEELRGISNVSGIDLSTIKMGTDTKIHPDAMGKLNTGEMVVLESKHVSSPAQGQVDYHVMAACTQIAKRMTIYKTKGTAFVARIVVNNPANPWPYTPTTYNKSKPAFANFNAVLEQRLTEYKERVGKIGPIRFSLKLDNFNKSIDIEIK